MYKVVSYYHEDQVAMSNFQKKANYLFSEYNFYIRELMLSILNGTHDLSAIIERLDDNANAIASLLTPYYPAATVTALADLFKVQVATIEQYIKLSLAKQDLTTVQAQWVTNTDEIGTLLNSIDPTRWPKSAVVTALTNQANFIHRQVVARMANDWVADIAATDLGYNNIIEFSNVVGNGIVVSNLEKFSKQ